MTTEIKPAEQPEMQLDQAAKPQQPATPPEPAPPTDLTAGAVEALDKALAAAEGLPPGADDAPPAKPVEAPADARPEEKGEKPADEAAKDGEPPKAETPEKTPEQEADELGLKAKARERFHELSGYKAAVKRAGIENLEDLPRIVERARVADQLEGAIQQTGATPEQYGQAIQYLALVNSGDPEALSKAYEIMQQELATLAKALGKEVPGVHDPLAEHPDLKQEVEEGDITRKRALEIAAQRAAMAQSQAVRQAQSAQQHRQREFEEAVQELNMLGAQLKQADPLYPAKVQALLPTIELIRENFPPTEWAARVKQAYAKVQVAAPAPAQQPLPPPGPVRSVAPAGVSVAPTPKNELDALEIGLQMASQIRR